MRQIQDNLLEVLANARPKKMPAMLQEESKATVVEN
jgi:hypothetical protein